MQEQRGVREAHVVYVSRVGRVALLGYRAQKARVITHGVAVSSLRGGHAAEEWVRGGHAAEGWVRGGHAAEGWEVLRDGGT